MRRLSYGDDVTLPPRQAESARATDVHDAALSLFAERGYHGTSMKDVAEAVGMRAPSLYNHIRTKQALLQATMLYTSRAVMSEFDAAVSGVADPVERLRRAVRAYALRHARHGREALVVNRELSALEDPVRTEVLMLRRAHQKAIQEVIEEGRRTGHFDIGSPGLASFAILEMAVSVGRWFKPERGLRPEEVADQYALFALRLVGRAP